MCFATSSTYPNPSGASTLSIPLVGKMPGIGPMPAANTISSRSPSQNVGTDHSTSDTPVENLSKRLPGFHPARAPCQMPRLTAITSAVPVSSSVEPMRSPIRSSTGRLYSYDVPRSKRTVWPTKSRNCSGSDLSSPSRRRSRSSCSGVMLRPCANARTGSPGSKRNAKNVATITIAILSSAPPTFDTAYRRSPRRAGSSAIASAAGGAMVTRGRPRRSCGGE